MKEINKVSLLVSKKGKQLKEYMGGKVRILEFI